MSIEKTQRGKKKTSRRLLLAAAMVFAVGVIVLLGMYINLCRVELTTEPITGDVYEFNADAVTMEQDGKAYVFTNNFIGDGENKLMYAWYVHKDGAGDPIYQRRYFLGNQFRFTPDDDGQPHIYEIKAWVLSPDGRHKNAYCSQTITQGLDYELTEEHKPINLIFTIDVEDDRGGVPNLIEGDLGEKGTYGVDYIMDCFEEHDMQAVFFTNVYEDINYSGEYEDYMENLVRRIDSRGHEVALHSHENPLLEGFFDKTLDNYNVDEQTEILEHGCSFIEKATGKRPITFRGGSYIANDDTFEAMRRCGIKYDSSSFYFHYNNAFSGYAAINQSYDVNGIIEFPVISIYDRAGKENKMDIDRLSWEELLTVIRQMQLKEDFPVVQIMFHSFTFLEQNPYGQQVSLIDEGNKQVYDVDIPDRESFNNLLRAISQDDSINVITFRDLEKMNYQAPSLSSDDIFYVPTEKGKNAAEVFDLSSAVTAE